MMGCLRIREKKWGSRCSLSRWTTVSGPVLGPCSNRVCEVVPDLGVSCMPLARVWIIHNHSLPVFLVVESFLFMFGGTATLNVTCKHAPKCKRDLLPATHYGSPSGTVQPKAPSLFDFAAAAALQVGAYASSARRPTSSSSTSYQHTQAHKAPRLLSPVAQPVASSAMSANG